MPAASPFDSAAYRTELAEIYARFPLLKDMTAPDPGVPDVARQWDERAAELCALDARYRQAARARNAEGEQT
jgi:hypothetical protein